MTLSPVLRGILSALFVMIMAVHIHLTTIGNPGTLKRMIHGKVKKRSGRRK